MIICEKLCSTVGSTRNCISWHLLKFFKFNLPQNNLLIETFANILRMLTAIDPAGTKGIMPESANGIFVLLPIILGFITTTCVAIYWQKLCKQYNFKWSNILIRFKRLIIGIIVCLLIANFAIMIMFASDNLDLVTAFQILGGLYFVLSIIIAFFFCYYGQKILQLIDRKNNETKIHYYVIIYGITIVLKAFYFLYYIVGFGDILYTYVYGGVVSYLFLNIFEYISSYSQILSYVT